jgi:hypothetical protein
MKVRSIAMIVLCAALASMAFAQDEAEKPKKAGWPVFLNIIPGFGVGSFSQKDSLGGSICLGGDLAGVGLITFGAVEVLVGTTGAITGGFFGALLGTKTDTTKEERMVSQGATLALIGSAVGLGTKIFGIIRPITYAHHYNNEHGLAISVSPTILPTSEEGKDSLSPGLSLQLSY